MNSATPTMTMSPASKLMRPGNRAMPCSHRHDRNPDNEKSVRWRCFQLGSASGDPGRMSVPWKGDSDVVSFSTMGDDP